MVGEEDEKSQDSSFSLFFSRKPSMSAVSVVPDACVADLYFLFIVVCFFLNAELFRSMF